MRQTGLELSVSTVVTMEIAIGLDVTNFPATFFTDNLLQQKSAKSDGGVEDCANTRVETAGLDEAKKL
jgi:hypothetical protein